MCGRLQPLPKLTQPHRVNLPHSPPGMLPNYLKCLPRPRTLNGFSARDKGLPKSSYRVLGLKPGYLKGRLDKRAEPDPVGSYTPKGGRSFLVGVLQDTVGNPRAAFRAMLLLHDGQCGWGVDLRNVVIVFQGPVGERSFEVRLDRRSFCMHVRHTCNDIHGPQSSRVKGG